MKKSILIVALFALTFSACKKSSDDSTPGCTLTEANFVGAYKIHLLNIKALHQLQK